MWHAFVIYTDAMALANNSVANCLICSGETRERSPLDGPFRLIECCDCHFQFVLPRPSLEELEAVYNGPGEAIVPCTRSQCEEAGSRLHRLISRFGASGTNVLEIGCNNGFNLGGLRSYGYSVTGTDLSASGVDFAQERIPEGTFYRTEFPPNTIAGTFDVLLAVHLIEHVIDPRAFVLRCASFLKPGGLFIILTPNVSSIGMRLFSRHYPVYCPPVHLNYFSGQTLFRLLKEDFKVEYFETNSAWTDPRNTLFNSIVSVSHIIGLKQKLRQSSCFQSGHTSEHSTGNGGSRKPWLMPLVRTSTQYAQAAMMPLFWVCNRMGFGENILLVARKRGTPRNA